MIRSERLTRTLLDAWLLERRLAGSHTRYRLRYWRENRAGLAGIKDELESYIDEAFEDARQRLRSGFGDDLSPFNGDPNSDPAANYPALLHRVTLQGYFGEILAVIAIEHWGAHGHTDWVVPAFLFRFHEVEFQHLELINQRLRGGGVHNPDEPEEIRPGRTGDDGLAFRTNADNLITDVLTIEAKCVNRHRSEEIKEAHEKLAQGLQLPVGVRELINLLSKYETPEANTWQEALLKLWRGGYHDAARYDCMAYTCAQIPRQAGRFTWLPVNEPHSSYTTTRPLEGMEFHFQDLPEIVLTLHRRE
jgi:hypothetical protein